MSERIHVDDIGTIIEIHISDPNGETIPVDGTTATLYVKKNGLTTIERTAQVLANPDDAKGVIVRYKTVVIGDLWTKAEVYILSAKVKLATGEEFNNTNKIYQEVVE